MGKFIAQISIAAFILTGCGPKMTPIEYNDAIIAEQTKMSQLMIDMTNEFEVFDFDKSETIRQDLVKQCEASVKTVKDMPDYKGNTRFRDAAVALFSFYKDISEKEYKEMIDILKKGAEITPEDITKLTQLEENLAGRETSLDNEFQTAQNEFAKEHNLELQDNALQKQIDQLGQ